MKTLILFFLCTLICAAKPNAGAIVEFGMDYATLENMAFREGRFDDLIQLNDIAPGKVDFIANFWRTKAMMAGQSYISELTERYAKKVTSTDPAEKDAMMKELMGKVSYVRCSYYYDHWKEIGDMIVLNLERAKKENAEAASSKK